MDEDLLGDPLPAAPMGVWMKVSDMATFTKLSGATLEITYNGRFQIGPSSSAPAVRFELRVDGNPTSVGTAQAECWRSEGTVRATFTGIFTGLSAGSHTVSMWARGSQGDALDVTVNPGNWAASLIIKEYK